MKIISLYDTVAIAKNWSFFIDGVKAILKHSAKDTNFTTIYNDLLGQKIFMWVIFIDNVYSGFFTAKFRYIPDGDGIMTVIQCFLKPTVPKEILGKVSEHINEIAKKANCKYIKCYSLRTGMEKRIKAFGFNPSYLEFIKEVT